MSKSFSKAQLEWFDNNKLASLPFFHELSQRYYDIEIRDDSPIFMRFQIDELGKRVNEVEYEISYLLGSGNKATTLLYRTPNDELFQIPINWYTEGQYWEMAPGYEGKHHQGISRRVQRECMFCHNSYPFLQMGQDNAENRDTFPKSLPEGIDCQRCHGPGALHINEVNSQETSIQKIRDSIVNPASLPPKQRDSVCFQCHLLPAVGMTGVRHFDRSDYSFRPGEDLSDYIVHVDIKDANMPQEKRFEINHHAYRLTQSNCFKESNGELSCISCHNPHEKQSGQNFANKVERACLGCHENSISSAHSKVESYDQKCVNCHMPQRRAQDVTQVVMTDHKIGVYSDEENRLAKITKQEPVYLEMSIWDRDIKMNRQEKDIYKLSTILVSTPSIEYANILKSLLQSTNYNKLKPYIILAETHIKLGNHQEGESTLKYARSRFGDNIKIEELLAVTYVAQKKDKDAEEKLLWLTKIDPGSADLFFNLGLLKYSQDAYEEAAGIFKHASSLRENFAIAVMYEALSVLKMNDELQAINLLKRSLAIDPLLGRSYEKLIRLLHKTGQRSEARNYYTLGLKNLPTSKRILSISSTKDLEYLKQQ